MQDFQKRRGLRAQALRAGLGALGIVLLGVIAFAAAQGAWRMYGKFTQAAAARHSGEVRLVELRREHERVARGVEELGTARGIEAEVRERYGLGRPGEGEITVVRPAPEESSASAATGIWQKLLEAFFVW